MNLNSYEEIINFLNNNKDPKYRDFYSKLLKNDNINLIGVRIPILKKMAKYIAKNDYSNFIKNNTHKTYEENMIHGLVIGYLKAPFKEILSYIDDFLVYNDNWSINDTVCANLKCFKNNQEEGYKYIKKILLSKNSFDIRFSLVLLLNYYINDKYIDNILKISSNIKADDYYVKMANAWLISKCFVKYKEKVLDYLSSNNLDIETKKMTIRKIKDSYKVSDIDKNNLKICIRI